MTAGAQNAAELLLLDHLRAGSAIVRWEHLLSGRGLVSLYRALGSSEVGVEGPEIVRRALALGEPLAGQTLDQFVAWLGRFAADAALAFRARGGIYLAGGIAPTIIDALNGPAFRQALAAGVAGHDLADVPTYVIKTGADAALRGAAVALGRSLEASETHRNEPRRVSIG
jgi:glucokinase